PAGVGTLGVSQGRGGAVKEGGGGVGGGGGGVVRVHACPLLLTIPYPLITIPFLYAARVSSLIISSRWSKSGISGDSLSMRTWQRIGPRSGNVRLGSDFTTSAFTRTSCGKPCVITPK